MPITEQTPRRLVLKGDSGTLTLDKNAGKAVLARKILMMARKPVEFALDDIDDVAVKSDQDALSGATIHHSVMHRRGGEIMVLTTEEAKAAAATVAALRKFLGLKA